MAFVVFRGERELAEVVERAFGKLKAADRKRAEAALVRANPQLAELEKLGRGSLIVVPPVPGIETRAEREADAPAADAIGELSETLKVYGRRLRAAADAEEKRLSAFEGLLDSGALKEGFGHIAEAEPYLERATEALKQRVAALAERRAALDRLAEAEGELAELEELMR